MTGPIQTSKRVRALGAAAAVAALLAGTVGTASGAYADGAGGRSGGSQGSDGRGSQDDDRRDGDSQSLEVDDGFVPASVFEPPGAVTYDEDLVPVGGWIEVQQRTDRKGTTVSVRVKGLKPGYPFGLHVHEKACGVAPEAAGKHYQHVKDPKLVNQENEVWLDLTTDATGSAEAFAHHSWGLPEGAANAVVLHREQGGAGDRVACLTVPFGDFESGDR